MPEVTLSKMSRERRLFALEARAVVKHGLDGPTLAGLQKVRRVCGWWWRLEVEVRIWKLQGWLKENSYAN